MGFLIQKDLAEEGDTVIVYLSYNLFYPLVLKAGETYQTKYGALRHNDVIGKQYGSKVPVKNGYVHFLWPTPELWTQCLPHRTQILYSRDISLTIYQLDLKPGSVVIESGTGSGSMTHCLARAVAPHGKVHSFDFHQVRSELAQAEFIQHGLDEIALCTHRDVCANGFGLNGVADAVFLDLPHPWLAIKHAIMALKDMGGRICSFSPCIEQVQKTCDKLRQCRCIEITTIECLERPYDVKKVHIPRQTASKEQGMIYFLESNEHNPMEVGEPEQELNEENAANQQPRDENLSKKRKANQNARNASVQVDDYLSAFPAVKIPGHTGYLTFATYVGRITEEGSSTSSPSSTLTPPPKSASTSSATSNSTS